MEKTVASFDGTAIHYAITRKEKPFLVLLHGAGGDLSAWNEERDAIHAKGYSTLAIDLRGHGKSGRPKSVNGYALQKIAEDVNVVLKKEGITEFILVGHCFGGVVSIMFHKLHPNMAKAYILIDTTFKAPAGLKRIFSGNKTMLMLFNRLLRRSEAVPPGVHVDFKKFKGTSDYDLKRIYSDITHTTFKSWMFIYQNLALFDGTATLTSMTQKVLIIVGDKDTIFDVNVAKKIHGLAKNSELKIIPEANHILVFNNPDGLNKEIIEFAKSIYQ